MADLHRKIESLEAQIADVRAVEFPLIEGVSDGVREVAEYAALRWRYKSLCDLYEKGRKMLDEALMEVVDLDEAIEVGDLVVKHQQTSFFDRAAWEARARGPFAEAWESEAVQHLDAYKAAEKTARESESYYKSGGLRVTLKKTAAI